MWPVFLIINELPQEVRFSIGNIILAGKLNKEFTIENSNKDCISN
jgi:hypothetical protein